MEKDYIINQLALAKAQLEVNYLELQYKCQELEREIEELKKGREQ